MCEGKKVDSRAFWAIPLAVLGMILWLWPIGAGGKMPVGGDVTQFSIGLVAFLGRALREGKLPLWNELWGYGFPGLGESQMGVFYLPHLLLYGTLGAETAYTISLVVHTLIGGLGAYWAARRFAISPVGAAFAAFIWTSCGFFVIHLPHQWGYTTGCWLPWAMGSAWSVIQGDRPRRSACWLAAILAIQVLPGHFQVGFITEISVTAVLAAGLFTLWREGKELRTRAWLAALALTGMLPLAAMQLGPTYDLARLASSARDWNYLAGFAATPLHLVSYVAPGLFRLSPLWRGLAWDAFHTSPEEYLGFVGVVPLLLAWRAVRSGGRRDPRVICLLVLVALTLFLSLGPYVPGSSILFRIPGFSFFRAPARWSIATALGLALLAGIGLDSWKDWERPGRRLVGFALSMLGVLVVVVGLVEGAFLATDSPGPSTLKSLYSQAFRLMPWQGDPSFADRMNEARQPFNDLRALTALARDGIERPTPVQLTLAKQRYEILARELAPTGLILVLIVVLAPFAGRWRRGASFFLVAITVLDLLIVIRQQRPTDLGPIQPLVEQSPLLAELKRVSEAARVVDSSRNLPILIGVSPVSAYRTLDLPAVPELTNLTREPLGRAETEPIIAGALRATGVKTRVLEPFEVRALKQRPLAMPGWRVATRLQDPALAGWLYGADFVGKNASWASEFVILESEAPSTIAWLIPLSAIKGQGGTGDLSTRQPLAILEIMRKAIPLRAERVRSETLRIEIPEKSEPGMIVISQLAHPGWSARWVGDAGQTSAAIERVFDGWQGVIRREPGPATLRLDYQERYLIPSVLVSAGSWCFWLVLMAGFLGRPSKKSDVPESD